jgi:dinuclear metal center YbgI/SA1388 family protein
MELLADPCLAEEWDNVGLLIGSKGQKIEKILVVLDVSQAAVNRAVNEKYDFIIAHHPLIYNPLKNITDGNPTGKKIIQLIKNNIGLYAAHTNLDITTGGVNDILFEKLGFINKESLMESGLGLVGNLTTSLSLEELAAYIKGKLSLSEVRYRDNPEQIIRKIGLCAGSAAGIRYIKTALEKNCDVYISGDFKYHDITEAAERDLNLIEINHYAAEAPIIGHIVTYILNEAQGEHKKITVTPFYENNNLMSII